MQSWIECAWYFLRKLAQMTKDMTRPKSQNRICEFRALAPKERACLFFSYPVTLLLVIMQLLAGIQSQIQLLYPDSLGMSNKRSRVHWHFYRCRNGFWNTGKRAVHVIEQSCSWQRWKCLAKDSDLTYCRFWSGGVSSKGPLWLKDPQRMRHIRPLAKDYLVVAVGIIPSDRNFIYLIWGSTYLKW